MSDTREPSARSSQSSTSDKTNQGLLQYSTDEQKVGGGYNNGDVRQSEGNAEIIKQQKANSRKSSTQTEICPINEREYILNVIKKVKSLGKGVKQKDIDPELVKRCYKFSPNMGKDKASGSVDGVVDKSDPVKREIKKVIGSLEGVLDELNHVVGDLRSVVSQIDDLTAEIEARGSPDSLRKLDTKLPHSSTEQLSTTTPSCDSGFVGCSFRGPKTAVKSHTGDQLMPADEATTKGVSDPNNSASATSCGSSNPGHIASHPRSIPGPKKTTPPLCKKCQLRKNNAQLPTTASSSCNYSSKSHSSVCSRLLENQTKHAREKHRDTTGYYAKVTRPQAVIARNYSIKSRSISCTAHSDSGDFYEKQLDQRLENLTGIDSQTQGFSTLDWFTLEKRSYSDTLFNGGDNGSDRESVDSSDEEEAILGKHKDGVLKASDTFRFKIKQISMRQVKTAHWRVVIQP